MTYKIDFALRPYFGVVAQTIFRLVLSGLINAEQIRSSLWVFSDLVIADAIRKLVNEQIIRVDLESRNLSLSDPVAAIIEVCVRTSYNLEMPETLEDMMVGGHLLISDANAKEAILSQLLPEIKLGFFAKSLDFSIYERGEIDER